MLRVERLTKRFGTFLALDELSFSADVGTVLGLLGPNGAGKTTALRIMAGVLGPTAGMVQIAGHDFESSPLTTRAKVGYLPESAPIYPEMRVAEFLQYRAALKRVRRRAREQAVGRVLSAVRIEDVANVRVMHLSRGYRQRLGMADALLADPPLLLLDEPTSGLDPNQLSDVRNSIRELGRTRLVVLSTHLLGEVEATCSRALVIHQGRLVAQGTLDELRGTQNAGEVAIRLAGSKDRIEAVAERLNGKSEARSDRPGDDLVLVVRPISGETMDAAAARAVDMVVSQGLSVREVTHRRRPLERVFAQLTGADGQKQ